MEDDANSTTDESQKSDAMDFVLNIREEETNLCEGDSIFHAVARNVLGYDEFHCGLRLMFLKHLELNRKYCASVLGLTEFPSILDRYMEEIWTNSSFGGAFEADMLGELFNTPVRISDSNTELLPSELFVDICINDSEESSRRYSSVARRRSLLVPGSTLLVQRLKSIADLDSSLSIADRYVSRFQALIKEALNVPQNNLPTIDGSLPVTNLSGHRFLFEVTGDSNENGLETIQYLKILYAKLGGNDDVEVGYLERRQALLIGEVLYVLYILDHKKSTLSETGLYYPQDLESLVQSLSFTAPDEPCRYSFEYYHNRNILSVVDSAQVKDKTTRQAVTEAIMKSVSTTLTGRKDELLVAEYAQRIDELVQWHSDNRVAQNFIDPNQMKRFKQVAVKRREEVLAQRLYSFRCAREELIKECNMSADKNPLRNSLSMEIDITKGEPRQYYSEVRLVRNYEQQLLLLSNKKQKYRSPKAFTKSISLVCIDAHMRQCVKDKLSRMDRKRGLSSNNNRVETQCKPKRQRQRSQAISPAVEMESTGPPSGMVVAGLAGSTALLSCMVSESNMPPPSPGRRLAYSLSRYISVPYDYVWVIQVLAFIALGVWLYFSYSPAKSASTAKFSSKFYDWRVEVMCLVGTAVGLYLIASFCIATWNLSPFAPPSYQLAAKLFSHIPPQHVAIAMLIAGFVIILISWWVYRWHSQRSKKLCVCGLPSCPYCFTTRGTITPYLIQPNQCYKDGDKRFYGRSMFNLSTCQNCESFEDMQYNIFYLRTLYETLSMRKNDAEKPIACARQLLQELEHLEVKFLQESFANELQRATSNDSLSLSSTVEYHYDHHDNILSVKSAPTGFWRRVGSSVRWVLSWFVTSENIAETRAKAVDAAVSSSVRSTLHAILPQVLMWQYARCVADAAAADQNQRAMFGLDAQRLAEQCQRHVHGLIATLFMHVADDCPLADIERKYQTQLSFEEKSERVKAALRMSDELHHIEELEQQIEELDIQVEESFYERDEEHPLDSEETRSLIALSEKLTAQRKHEIEMFDAKVEAGLLVIRQRIMSEERDEVLAGIYDETYHHVNIRSFRRKSPMVLRDIAANDAFPLSPLDHPYLLSMANSAGGGVPMIISGDKTLRQRLTAWIREPPYSMINGRVGILLAMVVLYSIFSAFVRGHPEIDSTTAYWHRVVGLMAIVIGVWVVASFAWEKYESRGHVWVGLLSPEGYLLITLLFATLNLPMPSQPNLATVVGMGSGQLVEGSSSKHRNLRGSNHSHSASKDDQNQSPSAENSNRSTYLRGSQS